MSERNIKNEKCIHFQVLVSRSVQCSIINAFLLLHRSHFHFALFFLCFQDLSSLLKALHDAVGSSIKIPSNGTKTLKLRLTVGQDNTQLPENKSPSKGKKEKVKDSDKVKVKDSDKVKEVPKSKEFAKLNNNLTATHVQLPAKQCNSDLQERVKGQCQNSCQVKGHNPCTAQSQDFLCSGSKRIQLTSQERQQLVELVQENMERNHVKQLR